MTKLDMLDALCDLTRELVAEIVLPVKPQKGSPNPEPRAAEVHKMRLPNSSAAKDKAPYIIHQVITGRDVQPRGQDEASIVVVRSIFSAFNEESEEEGALMLLNLMERVRIGLLKKVFLVSRYQLDMDAGIEFLVYPDDTAPFFAGEMVSTWKVPAIQKEVDFTNGY